MGHWIKTLIHLNWSAILLKVGCVFLQFGIVAAAYHFSKHTFLTKENESPLPDTKLNTVKKYALILGGCLIIGGLSGLYLGTHSERSSDPDEPPEIVEDWQPTDEQRLTRVAKVFLVLAIPAAFGVHAGIKEERKRFPRNNPSMKQF